MATRIPHEINNRVYHTLGARWYTAQDDPVALLRAESRLHLPWVTQRLLSQLGRGASVLDLGCGAGFLSNQLARTGFEVHGLDASPDALDVARQHDATRRVVYECGDALSLPYAEASFGAVCAMDLLEHVQNPARLIQEVSRVLEPGGLFFFHTFNRNLLSYLVVVKGVEWFVKNTPPNLHLLRLFVRPHEVYRVCTRSGLDMVEVHGTRPRLSLAFLKMLLTRVVPSDFAFRFTRSLRLGYAGMARRAPLARVVSPSSSVSLRLEQQ